MKRIKNLIITVLAILCLFMLGAWAPAYSYSSNDRYIDVEIYSLYSSETISFDRKETDSKLNSAPHFVALTGMTNACGAVAGTEIVAYYDKYYPNMIPDWQSFFSATGKYKQQDKVYIPNIMNELYSLMRTNIDDAGVSENDFISGLTQYINGQGYNLSMQSVMSGTTIDYASCKTALNNNKVITLLSRATDLYDLSEGTTQDSIGTITISGSHIMIANGYKEIKYYKGNTLIRTDRYLIVSTGLEGVQTAFYKLNPHSLNSAYIVNII